MFDDNWTIEKCVALCASRYQRSIIWGVSLSATTLILIHVLQVTSPSSKVQNQNGIQTTKIPRVSKDQSETKKGELAPQEADPDRDIMTFLVKDLKDEDFLMETPVAAYFTLILGT